MVGPNGKIKTEKHLMNFTENNITKKLFAKSINNVIYI